MSKKSNKQKEDPKIMVAQIKGHIKNATIQLEGQKREKELRAKLDDYKMNHKTLSAGRDKPDYFYEQEFWDLSLELDSLGAEAVKLNLQASIDTNEQDIKFAKERLESYENEVVQ